MSETRVYDAATGHLTGITSSSSTAGLIQNLSYNFDTLGNLLARTDSIQAITESFVYDNLNRVTSSTVAPSGQNTGGTTVSVAYDALGNITSKSDIGAYTYGPGTTCTNTFAGPHAVSSVAGTKNANYCYDNVGNLTQGDGRTVAWTAFNMPSQIVQGTRQIAITYGPDRARFKRVDINETGTSTTYYVAGGGHEVVTSGTTVTHKTYVGGVAVVIETTSTPTSTQTIYLLKDHLGSTDVITDSTGAVQNGGRFSFDAWGKRRDVNWAAFFPTVPTSLWQTTLTTRGYTGHEQLDQVGLVHMNGRVYDPELGRFLSADSFIQDPSNLQSLNPYSYVQNNPLSFTDPTGHFLSGLFKAIGHFFSNIWHAITGALKSLLKNSIIRSLLQLAACAFGGPIGCIAAANIAKVLVHGVVAGALRLAQGGSFLEGFASGAIGEVATLGSGSLGNNLGLRLAIVSAAGGLASQLTGGKFANGALTAAFAFLFNWASHRVPTGVNVIYVGGAGDDTTTSWFNAQLSVETYKGLFDAGSNFANVQYYTWNQKSAIEEYISNLDNGNPIILIGHSWGADTAAQVAMAMPGKIDYLITVDPVSWFTGVANSDLYSKISNSVRTWVDINAAPPPGTRNLSDFWATIGGKWDTGPANSANIYIEAKTNHGNFPMMMGYVCGTGKLPC